MMSLPDVYCLYNRARGTGASPRNVLPCAPTYWLTAELVSPQELLEAATLTSSLHLPIVLRRFPSGVLVLQQASQSDDALCARTCTCSVSLLVCVARSLLPLD